MEILSPAGNINLINSAIKAKSNAVYGGFKLWNARNNAVNFTLDEYNIAITKIHNNNMKFYLTLNNLVLDEEINQIVMFLKNERLILPDAFIVADLGLAIKLKEEFPNVALHISTQFGTHNIEDIKFLEELQVDRAILAREMTLEELKKLRKETNMELECFVWGSQCLSFSGLCFFGSLINGGTGNRGKCINMCRDVYSFKNINGNLLYVSDMNAINLVPQLKEIESLKIEGRRREPLEVENVINKVKKGKDDTNVAGYLFGEEEEKNKLHYIVNRRIKPLYKANELNKIDKNDVFVKVQNDEIIKFCDSQEDDAYYVYTEILQDYSIEKYNYYMELFLNEMGNIQKISITNYKGENTIIQTSAENLIFKSFEPEKYMYSIEDKYSNMKLIKIKYLKNINGYINISDKTYKELSNFFQSEYEKINKTFNRNKNSVKVDCLYIQSGKKDLIAKYLNEKNVKFIYEIASIDELRNIENIINLLGKNVIYRLPVFNWKGENIETYCKKLVGFEVMFTRYSQIHSCRKLDFSKRYADYLVYSWNHIAKDKLKEMGIDEFCASPELSYKQNYDIFKGENVQYFFGGRPSLVYSRNCFKKLFKCDKCNKSNKEIINKSKNMDFTIVCKKDHREIFYNTPILNNYSNVDFLNNCKLRYVLNFNDEKEIEILIAGMKSDNLYNFIKEHKLWEKAYECNLLEGKE